MKNRRIPKKHDLTGSFFNDWQVLGLSEYRATSDRDRYWDCRCKCGKEKPVRACYLKGGHSKQCVDCAHEKQKIKGRIIPRCFWEQCIYNAGKRLIEFSISKEDVIDLFKRQNGLCALSGVPIMFAETESQHLKGETTASIDRINSEIGYFPTNIQLVHKTVNFMKHTLVESNFLFFCESIVNYQKELCGKC